MSEKFPSQTQDKFTVRFPDGLRDAIAERAKANGRSMNSEIVQILQDAIDSSVDEEIERLKKESEKVNSDFWSNAQMDKDVHLDERLKHLNDIAERLENLMTTQFIQQVLQKADYPPLSSYIEKEEDEKK
ncbi:Arc family DNA-binding protein [Pectobacterium betavasculorum]|uniref:Arc family DNA-binding protein n=1 Tax=Pectobacterium betavasculorum TaxID=55207 RepID=UPI00313B03F5